jgi:ADP-heptose:LPS heptosyltransferase
MNPAGMRWIDRNIGIPVCRVLTLHRRLASLFRRTAPARSSCSKILFIKLAEQGSTVLAAPALKKAAELVGRQNLYFLVFSENRPILDILGIVPAGNIIEINSDNIGKFIYTTLAALIKIRRQKIDAVCDGEFFSRASSILAYLCGATQRVGLHLFGSEGPYRGDLFTHRLLYNPYLHTSIFFLSLVEALKYQPPEENIPLIFDIPQNTGELPRFFCSQKERDTLITKIETIKQSSLGRPVIVFHPKIYDLLPARSWPKNNYIDLGRKIVEVFPKATILITGVDKEKDALSQIAGRIANSVSLAGELKLKELLTLYHSADCLITTDSGPAHFAALTPIKSIILFGPETSVLYEPLSDNTDIITSKLICSPCVNVFNQRESACSSARCLEAIRVEDVLEKLKEIL